VFFYSPFFPCTMNLSTADLRNYRTEFHETWWSYRYMFLVKTISLQTLFGRLKYEKTYTTLHITGI
jgi:hypothetical protein